MKDYEKAGITHLYQTDPEEFARRGQSVAFSKHAESDTFGLAFYNARETDMTGYVVLERDELMRLRDAITKELAS